MCACEWNFVCSQCAGTPNDWRYFDVPDERESERERAEEMAYRLSLARTLAEVGR